MKFVLAWLLILSFTANAGTVSRLVEFQPNTKAQAEEVNAEFDNLISTINGAINSENIQDGGVATADLATASITAIKIASYTITQVKLASFTPGLSSLIDTAISGNSATADVATVTISTFGRPVFVGLVPSSASSANIAEISLSRTTTAAGIGTVVTGNFLLARNTQSGQSSHVTRWIPSYFAAATANIADSPNNILKATIPPGQFWTIDPITAGTWTYALRVSANDATTSVQLKNLKLIAYEL